MVFRLATATSICRSSVTIYSAKIIVEALGVSEPYATEIADRERMTGHSEVMYDDCIVRQVQAGEGLVTCSC